jgi:hypothetical protein
MAQDRIKELEAKVKALELRVQGLNAQLKQLRDARGGVDASKGGIMRYRKWLLEHFPEHVARITKRQRHGIYTMGPEMEAALAGDKKLQKAITERHVEKRREQQRHRRSYAALVRKARAASR